MTFCSPFPPTAVATSRRRQKERGGRDRDASREMDKTEWRGRRDDEKGKEWWKIANPHLCLFPLRLSPCPSTTAATFPLCCLFPHLPRISALILLPRLSAEADRGHALPAGSTKVCGGGLAVSNEIPSVRFQTSTASLAFSNTGTKWWTGRG